VQGARAKGKSRRRREPAYDDSDGVSRAAVQCALGIREHIGKALDNIPAAELPGLVIALRDEFRSIIITIKKAMRKSRRPRK
jgi:hypothetical protein